MVEILKLPHGWSLYKDCGDPFFRHRDGRVRTPFEFSACPEARTVFRDLKRELDIADTDWTAPGEHGSFRAMDKAKIALQLSLQTRRRWSPELLETG